MSDLPSVSASEPAQASTAVGSALSGVVVAAIPAAVVYFVGWAYLHYYLAEFGIDIAELELGTETIFIYAAPPVFFAVKSFWWLLLLLSLVGALLWRYLRRSFTSISRPQRLTQGIRPSIKGIIAFFLLVLLAMALAPLIKHVAVDRADEKWGRVGVRIQAGVAKPEEGNIQYADYISCAERRVLDLIFADKNVYYLLCIAEINDGSGAVYEVRRTDARLASARPARRSPAGRGGN